MKITKILGLVLLLTACGVILHAADCKSITDTSKRFDPLKDEANHVPLMQVISAGIDPDEEIFTNEIRRPDQMGLVANDTTGAVKRLVFQYEMDSTSTTETPVYKVTTAGLKIPILDADGNPVPLLDSLGKYVWQASTGMSGLDKVEKIKRDATETPLLDSEGNPQLDLDTAGKIVWESGQEIQNRALQTNAQSDLVDRPRMSVGIWCPFVEPAPVVRTTTQLDGTKAKIFLNSNSTTKGEFPYVVKDMASGKFYVFKDVKYKWKFEHTGHDDEATQKVVTKKATATTAEETQLVPIANGGKNNLDGESGSVTWTPFFEYTKTIQEAGNFLVKFGGDQSATLTEKKVFANHHTTAYDTGISSVQSTSQSNILQAIMMTLSYKRAEVEGTAEGPGYPEGNSGTADPINGIAMDASKFDLKPEKAPLAASLTETIVTNAVSPEYAGVIEDDGTASGTKMWGDSSVMGKGTAYKLVYVEDYKEPDSPPVPYTGGAATGQYFYKATIGGTIDRDIIIGYQMPNPKTQNAASQESGVKLKYYCGNGDIFRVDNPFFGSTSYGTAESKTRPYLNFFFMGGNNMFGPYACPVPLGKMKEWYTKRQNYWKTTANGGTMDPAKTQAYITEKLRNAFPSDSIPKWQMGYVFYIMGTDASGGDAIPLTQAINESWRAGSVATNTKFVNFLAILNETKTTNPAAQYAFDCVTELKKFIETPANVAPAKLQPPATFKGQAYRKFYRFALCGYDPMQGSFCVGPQELEKDNPAVIVERVDNLGTEADPVEVLTGTLTVHLERMIMCSCYVNDAKDECSLDVYGSKQTVSVAIAGCCGAITTVTPGVENQRQGTEIVDQGGTDNAGIGLPVPQLSVSDSGGEKGISIPSNFEMKAGETLYVVDKATSQPVGAGSNGVAGQYAAGTFPGNFDASQYSFSTVAADAAGNPGNVAQAVPITFSEGAGPGDLLLSEDERVAITTGGYDNVDRGSKGMGVGKAQLTITNLQTNLPENLEYVDVDGIKQAPSDGKIVIAPKAAIPGSPTVGEMFAFDPRIQVYHIFRDPGKYKADYTVWESSFPVGTQPKSRTLSFNIIVRDVKQQNRSIEDRNSRQ